jgi:hypothetical protein
VETFYNFDVHYVRNAPNLHQTRVIIVFSITKIIKSPLYIWAILDRDKETGQYALLKKKGILKMMSPTDIAILVCKYVKEDMRLGDEEMRARLEVKESGVAVEQTFRVMPVQGSSETPYMPVDKILPAKDVAIESAVLSSTFNVSPPPVRKDRSEVTLKSAPFVAPEFVPSFPAEFVPSSHAFKNTSAYDITPIESTVATIPDRFEQMQRSFPNYPLSMSEPLVSHGGFHVSHSTPSMSTVYPSSSFERLDNLAQPAAPEPPKTPHPKMTKENVIRTLRQNPEGLEVREICLLILGKNPLRDKAESIDIQTVKRIVYVVV